MRVDSLLSVLVGLRRGEAIASFSRSSWQLKADCWCLCRTENQGLSGKTDEDMSILSHTVTNEQTRHLLAKADKLQTEVHTKKHGWVCKNDRRSGQSPRFPSNCFSCLSQAAFQQHSRVQLCGISHRGSDRDNDPDGKRQPKGIKVCA